MIIDYTARYRLGSHPKDFQSCQIITCPKCQQRGVYLDGSVIHIVGREPIEVFGQLWQALRVMDACHVSARDFDSSSALHVTEDPK